jgi:hypothetical protein
MIETVADTFESASPPLESAVGEREAAAFDQFIPKFAPSHLGVIPTPFTVKGFDNEHP